MRPCLSRALFHSLTTLSSPPTLTTLPFTVTRPAHNLHEALSKTILFVLSLRPRARFKYCLAQCRSGKRSIFIGGSFSIPQTQKTTKKAAYIQNIME